MLMLQLAVGIALGVALIPVAIRMVAFVGALPGLLWRALIHPVGLMAALLLLGTLWQAITLPSCRPSLASFAHSSQPPLH